jgi:hypothetical protein
MVIIASFALLLVVNVVRSVRRSSAAEGLDLGRPAAGLRHGDSGSSAPSGPAFQACSTRRPSASVGGDTSSRRCGSDVRLLPLHSERGLRAFGGNLEATILLVAAGIVILGRIANPDDPGGSLAARTEWLTVPEPRPRVTHAALGAASLSASSWIERSFRASRSRGGAAKLELLL